MSDIAARALRLLESCQMPSYDPEGADTYPAVEDGGVNSIGNALAAAQVLANLAIAEELRRLNEGRDQWYREVLEVLTRAKDSEGSPVGSGQPAAAPVCRVCGKPGIEGECTEGPLTGGQWRAHLRAVMDEAPDWAMTHLDRHNWAVGPMTAGFGPCPEESP